MSTSDIVEIGPHLLRTFSFVQEAGRWVTITDIAEGANVSRRTANNHAQKFVALGVFEMVELAGGHRYRLADNAARKSRGLFDRLDAAREALNMNIASPAA